ncbi:4Fe-4S binding protein [Runella sp.]|uniref:4Fe-4S binding protein n=1 Tax=Runella sp. TaxID=1960881 RepID=UPI003D0B0B99
MNAYFQHINEGIRTTLAGMKLTLKHLWDARKRRSNHNIRENDYFQEQTGMVTLQYPFETMPIPDNGRYRLHNEMDDCIVCDKCAKVCPVDCIDIEPIKATEEIGKASDGSPIRLYAAVFDIDMAKCCYCGLCTTVCPTECLTMTKTFDYSEFNVKDMNYHYANLTPEVATEKKTLYEQFLLEKEALKKQKAAPQPTEAIAEPIAKPKPAFAPKKPAVENPQTPIESPEPVANAESSAVEPKPKPVFAPKKPVTDSQQSLESSAPAPKPKPVFAPKKPVTDNPQVAPESPQTVANIEATPKPKPIFAPKKPVAPVENQAPIIEKSEEEEPKTQPAEAQTARPKPVFMPKKPAAPPENQAPSVEKSAIESKEEIISPPTAKTKPLFVPKKSAAQPTKESLPPEVSEPETPETKNIDLDEVQPKPKPIFKPTMRPKKEE